MSLDRMEDKASLNSDMDFIQTRIEALKWASGAVRALESFPESNLKDQTHDDLTRFLSRSPIKDHSLENRKLSHEVQVLKTELEKSRRVRNSDRSEVPTPPDVKPKPFQASVNSRMENWGCLIIILIIIAICIFTFLFIKKRNETTGLHFTNRHKVYALRLSKIPYIGSTSYGN